MKKLTDIVVKGAKPGKSIKKLSDGGGKPISISTVHHTVQAIKEFLAWLHGRQEYRCRIKTADIAYLNLTTGEERQAHTSGPKQYATLEEYRTALFAMPVATEIERRDQAIVALMLLTCMRDAAAISLKLKHIARYGKKENRIVVG